MPWRIEANVSEGVRDALAERQRATGESMDHMVDMLLSEALDLERHSLFQVSTSNALVQGVFGGAITVGALKSHGDFGIGTFSGLDGELVLVDGECYRAAAGGHVDVADEDRLVPFAVVAHFVADEAHPVPAGRSMSELAEQIDGIRPSENVFVGARLDGKFSRIAMRAACKALPGEGLLEATGHQSEFDASDVSGSLIGFWSPPYARSIGVPGYHFHFISDDRRLGGHVLGLRSGGGRLSLHIESDLHLALPATAEFLRADLSGEHQSELDAAESGQPS